MSNINRELLEIALGAAAPEDYSAQPEADEVARFYEAAEQAYKVGFSDGHRKGHEEGYHGGIADERKATQKAQMSMETIGHRLLGKGT